MPNDLSGINDADYMDFTFMYAVYNCNEIYSRLFNRHHRCSESVFLKRRVLRLAGRVFFV